MRPKLVAYPVAFVLALAASATLSIAAPASDLRLAQSLVHSSNTRTSSCRFSACCHNDIGLWVGSNGYALSPGTSMRKGAQPANRAAV